MAGDNAAMFTCVDATTLQQCVSDKMAALHTAEKVAEAHTHMCTIAPLLEEEQASATTLDVEVVVVALELVPTTASASALPSPPFKGDATVVAMLHAQTCGV
jgi:hypothetical protein